MLNFEQGEKYKAPVECGQTPVRECYDPMPGILKEIKTARNKVKEAEALYGIVIEQYDAAIARERESLAALYKTLNV
jgi:hypothetical protein